MTVRSSVGRRVRSEAGAVAGAAKESCFSTLFPLGCCPSDEKRFEPLAGAGASSLGRGRGRERAALKLNARP
jgi:hypothetical protein